MNDEIIRTEKEIFELTQKLGKLRKETTPEPVTNYQFETLDGPRTLLELFAGRETLLVIHNMGQGCRYCTLWADGFNAFLPHLESAMAVVLVSKDAPDAQRRFANSRNWRYRMASHGGGAYIREQGLSADSTNEPGVVCYTREGEKIFKKNVAGFGPGDVFCSFWHLMSLAGRGWEDFTPQFNYWKRPEIMDDGGQNLL